MDEYALLSTRAAQAAPSVLVRGRTTTTSGSPCSCRLVSTARTARSVEGFLRRFPATSSITGTPLMASAS